MKIAINASDLDPRNSTRGIGVYARQLSQNLRKVDKKNQHILATSKKELQAADLIHYPTFDLFFHTLPIKKKSPRVVTIHDLIPLVYPSKFKPGFRGRVKFQLQLKALKHTDAIITDSQNSKTDIIKYLNIPRSKIHVVYLGVSKDFKKLQSAPTLKKTSLKYNLTNSFILYVGDVNYNKNVITLLEAFSKLDNSQLDLVMVSKAWKKSHIPEVKAIDKKISELAINNRIKKISKLSTDSVKDLVRLYNLAKVYVQPSLYEGFGLPVLEAMACGTIVVSSNAASLPEVYGKAAIMVNPTSSEISKGIKKALSLSHNQKQALINAGLQQAAKFTWERTAKETIKVYNSVLRL